MSPEGKMSNDGGRPFGMVMRADFLINLFFFSWWLFGEGDWCKNRSGGGRDVCEGFWKGGFSQFRSTVGGDYIGVADGLGMSIGDSGEDDRRSVVMSGGGGACVGSRGVSNRRLLQAPMSYMRALGRPHIKFPIPFRLFFNSFPNKVFLLVDLDRKR